MPILRLTRARRPSLDDMEAPPAPARRRVVRAAPRPSRNAPEPAAPGEGETADASVAHGQGRIIHIEIDRSATLQSGPMSEAMRKVRSQSRPMRDETKYLHVSDLLHRCLRRKALHKKYGTKPRAQELTLNDQYTFAQGDAIGGKTTELLTLAVPDKLWGKWRCVCGHLTHDDPCRLSETDTDEVCPKCNTKCNKYVEVSMRDDDLNVVGNPDAILWREELKAYHIGEVKSIKHENWMELARPQPDHMLQVVFYWYLMNKLGYPLVDKVSVFYVTKGWVFGAGHPYKEFVVDVLSHLPRIQPMIDDARTYKNYATGRGPLPPRVMCATEDSPDAKKCEKCAICFQED